MHLMPSALSQHLKQGLHPIYAIFGEEPLQYQESLDQIRSRATQTGLGGREYQKLEPSSAWTELSTSLHTGGLFATKRTIEYEISTQNMTKECDVQITALIQSFSDQKGLLIIHSPQAQNKIKNTAWFKSLETRACMIQCKILSRLQQRQWIAERLKRAGFEATAWVLDHFLAHIEGNLLAAQQTIEKLRLYGAAPCLDVATLDLLSTPHARYQVFELMDAILSGSLHRVAHMVDTLEQRGQSDPALIAWAIHRELSLLIPLSAPALQDNRQQHLNNRGVWQSRQALIQNFLTHHSQKELQHMLMRLKDLDALLKGQAFGDPWSATKALCLNIAGAPVL